MRALIALVDFIGRENLAWDTVMSGRPGSEDLA